MEHFIVPRSGKPPLVFDGDLIVSECTEPESDSGRGYTIKIYRTRQEYVVHVHFTTKWHRTEADHDWAQTIVTPAQLSQVLTESYDPLRHVVGYPPAERFRELQVRLEDGLRMQWDELVGRVLAKVPETGEAP